MKLTVEGGDENCGKVKVNEKDDEQLASYRASCGKVTRQLLNSGTAGRSL